MPTSSQSRILSVVDQQLLQQQQQQTNGEEIINSKRCLSVGKQSPTLINRNLRRRSSLKLNDTKNIEDSQPQSTSRTSQRSDVLHLSVVNLNNKTIIPSKSLSTNRRSSLNFDNSIKTTSPVDQNLSFSDIDDDENSDSERRPNLLNESARRLLVLGTIRPSKTFYKDLATVDVEHLMEYFQRMRQTNRRISSDEINQELKTKSIEYKPKMFFDSTIVTKHQVNQIEKILQPYLEQIRSHQAELIKLDNPIRFVIQNKQTDTSLTTIPREYNDCLLTLVSRTDPLRKSDLINEITSEKLVEDIKTNSLDISYFPGGINYDIAREEIDDKGQMNIENYRKLKHRLAHQKIWFFSNPPEKKPNALIAILPVNSSQTITHQCLLDTLAKYLKSLSNDKNFNIEQKILSIEYIPLSSILDSSQISDEFLFDCDCQETKQQLLNQKLNIQLNKKQISVDLQSYDEQMRKEYEKFLKAEKYHELIRNHEHAVKQTANK